MEKTICTLLADLSTNFEQSKTPDNTDQNEVTQELVKNMTNTGHLAPRKPSSTTWRTVCHTRTEQPKLENEKSTSPIHPWISQTA
jgi:hypothetical protein